ncbi:heterokaryon incompatibility protein [Diaporthe eres]|nr:heterokaryon incompatibility protein [Diaporthe eres]
MIHLRGLLKSAEWDLVAKYDADDFRRYQVTCDGFHGSRQSLTSWMDHPKRGFPELWTQVDACPGLDLTLLDISLLPIAIFEGGWGSPAHVQGLVLTPKDAAAGICERVAHFRASGTLAAYLFMEKLSGNRGQGALQTSSVRREVLDPKGRVEGFAFNGTRRWTKVQERDIILV